MLRTRARRGVVTGTALLVGLAGLTIGQGTAHASAPLPVTAAGPVALWGSGDTTDGLPVPPLTPDQTSEAFTKVVANGLGSAIGLTADGTVETLGTNIYAGAPYHYDQIPTIPAGQKVVDIAGDAVHGSGMAVTNTGDVYRWSTPVDAWNDPSNVPAANQLKGSKAVAISPDGSLAAVVETDGSVLVWGNTTTNDYGQKTPPADLTDVTAVYFNANGSDVYALKSDGTLAAWGTNASGLTVLPEVTTDSTDDVNVTDLASLGNSAVALLSNGHLEAWGSLTGAGDTDALPEDVAGKDIVALTSTTKAYIALDSEGGVHVWGEGGDTIDPAFKQLPDDIDATHITGLSANSYFATAIQATYGYLARPKVSGTAKVGQTLTATHATFTATPDSTTGQWLANGTKIAGATGSTLKLTTAQTGKTITYAETAKLGNLSATATSTPTAAVAALSTGGGSTTTQPGGGHTTQPVVQNPQLVKDQAKLKKDQAKLKKAKKKLKKAKKAHNAKKVKKLKKKVKKLKKSVKKDKKHIKADR